MLSRLMPKEYGFFDLFAELGETLVKSAHEFRSLLQSPDLAERYVQSIKDIEHHADDITHRTMTLLHKTFITPLDRDQIHTLIKTMDDIVDFIDASAQRILLFDIRTVPADMVQLADITVDSCELVKKSVAGLKYLKHPQELMASCVEINRLENEADHVLRAAVAKLFREETDMRNLIKLKELYELMETVTDRCEDVANVIEGIVLEYA